MGAAGVVAVFIAAAAASCSTQITEIQVGDDGGGLDGAASAAVIGPAGGVVRLGQASITVPAGALSTTTTIRISVHEGSPPPPYVAYSSVYEFDPAGLTFTVPATVVLPEHGAPESASVYWSTVDPHRYARLSTVLADGLATAHVTHFSLGFVGTVGSADGGPGDGSGPDGSTDAVVHDVATDDGSGSDSEQADAAGDSGPGDGGSESSCSPPVYGIVTLASGLPYPFGLAVSASAAFWTDPVANTVSKVSLSDCSVSTISSTADNPVGVILHGKFVYWTNGNGGGTAGSIMRAPQAGGAVTTLATGLFSPGEIVTDGTSLYWTANTDTMPDGVYELPIGGGTVATLTGTGYSLDLALNGGTVYWTDDGDDTVLSMPTGGGTVTTLATGLTAPDTIATDGVSLYWVASGSPGSVMKLALGADGGSPVTLAAGIANPSGIVTDGVSVYFGSDVTAGSVLKVPVGGGSVVTLAAGEANVTRLRIDATSVYWTGGVGGTVKKLTPR